MADGKDGPATTANERLECSVLGRSINLKVPEFWPNKVVLWFHQLEAQFVLANISSDKVKYSHVISNLDSRTIDEIEDIVSTPPESDKYQAVKERLIERLTDSQAQRVRKLLESEELGDQTPSQFYRRMKKIAANSVTNDFLVELWMKRLPHATQVILAATSDTDGEKLAAVADRIHEIPVDRRNIAEVSNSGSDRSDIKNLCEELRQMRLEINEIKRDNRARSRPRGRHNSRSRSRGRSIGKKKDLCWYHHKFRDSANKCQPGCKWNAGNAEDRR